MKNRTVLVLFVLALSFIAAPALAAGTYFGGEAGAVLLSKQKLTLAGIDVAENKTKAGFGVGLVGGYDFGTYRLEGEFAYRKNNNKEAAITVIDNASGPVKGDTSSMALMVNGYYDFRTVSPVFVPYLGVGIGGARVSFKLQDVDGFTAIDDSKMVFAYQFAAGFGYVVSKEFTLDLGYKYFATARPEFEVSGSGGVKVEGEYASHNIFLGARIGF